MRASLLLLSAALLAVASSAGATVFTVNSTADTGVATPDGVCSASCTLREAVQEANFVTTDDIINFAISGAGPHTIALLSSLPVINGTLTVDGYSQPGASENTLEKGDDAVLMIRVDGNNAGFSAAFNFTSSNCVVRGLSLTRFSQSAAIVLSGADNCRIEGNFIGTGPNGTKAGQGNGWGIFLQRDFADATDKTLNNIIGGILPAQRNLISGNSMGIEITQGEGNQVWGNYIGTDRSGTGDLSNTNGGVIYSSDAANSLVGGVAGAMNVIAFNGQNGVTVRGTANAISILRNAVFSNAGLGIDLGDDDVTPNDFGDTDAGANNLQNFPVLDFAETFSGKTVIKGKLISAPSTIYIIQIFSSPEKAPSGFGEGKTFLGEGTLTTSAGGEASFTFKTSKPLKSGLRITATATDSLGSTSEFSRTRKVVRR